MSSGVWYSSMSSANLCFLILLHFNDWPLQLSIISYENRRELAISSDIPYNDSQLIKTSWNWNFMGAVSLPYIEGTVSPQRPYSLTLRIFCPLLLCYSLILRHRACIIDVSFGVVHPPVSCSVFWPVVVFWKGLYLLQNELLWWGSKSSSYLWV